MKSLERLLDSIRIYDCSFTKVRVGGKHDGGYVVADEVCRATDRVYSFGIGDDVSFELGLLETYQNIKKVNLFDPYIDELPASHGKFSFSKIGIGDDYPESRYVSAWPAYQHGSNDLLKMDVEGSEWSAFRDMFWAVLNGFSQIVVEFHVFHIMPVVGFSPYFTSIYQKWADRVNNHCFEMYYEVLKKISGFFTCFHAHANNSLPMVELGGFRFPPLIEMSFVRKDKIRTNVKEAEGPFPVGGLDSPNKTDRPDIIDWYPLIRRKDAKRKVKANQA